MNWSPKVRAVVGLLVLAAVCYIWPVSIAFVLGTTGGLLIDYDLLASGVGQFVARVRPK